MDNEATVLAVLLFVYVVGIIGYMNRQNMAYYRSQPKVIYPKRPRWYNRERWTVQIKRGKLIDTPLNHRTYLGARFNAWGIWRRFSGSRAGVVITLQRISKE